MDPTTVSRFVTEWVDAWNAHDLERLLAHYTDDVTFTSPVAAQLLPGSDGVLRGKEALREYWAEGLRRIPDLRFEVVAAYAGVDLVVINYRNQRGGLVCEVLHFDSTDTDSTDSTHSTHSGLVRSGHGTYLEADNPAGAR